MVASLMDEDGYSIGAVAKALDHKQSWVTKRLALRRLASPLIPRLDRGSMSLSVALELCAFARTVQIRLADAIARHRLSWREAKIFLTTYRLAPDAATQEALLGDPRGAAPEPADQGGSPLGSTAASR